MVLYIRGPIKGGSMTNRGGSFFGACLVAAALFILIGSGSAAAKGTGNGTFAAKPRIDSVSLRCHYKGSARDLVRADINVRHADVARKAGYGRRFLKVKSRVRVEDRSGRKLAVLKSSGSLRTGARGRLIGHRYHRYFNRNAGQRILSYIGTGGDCRRKVGARRKLDVRVRISQQLKPVSGGVVSTPVAAGSSANAVGATRNLRTGISSADPPLFRSPILSATGGNASNQAFGLSIARFTSLPIPDVAINNFADRNVSVLLGTGAGSFTPAAGSPIDMGPSNSPQAVTSADFNGDGKQDLAVAVSSGRLNVFLGTGEGTFKPAPGSPAAISGDSWSLAAGDLDGDGDTDLTVSYYSSSFISVMLGDGKGGFVQAAGSPVTTGTGFSSVAIGQFTRFPKADLAVASSNSNQLSVLLGSGTGQFAPAANSPIAVDSGPNSVAVGDMNRDGNEDLVVSRLNAARVSILLGDGSGGFTEAPGSPHFIGGSPLDVAVADLNQDGRKDIASVGFPGTTVLLNGGGGDYAPAPGSPFAAGRAPWSIAVADLNGDGKPDLGVADAGPKVANFAALLNNG